MVAMTRLPTLRLPLLQYGFTDEPSTAFPQPPADSLLGQFLPHPLCPIGIVFDEDHGCAEAQPNVQSGPVRGSVTCCAFSCHQE